MGASRNRELSRADGDLVRNEVSRAFRDSNRQIDQRLASRDHAGESQRAPGDDLVDLHGPALIWHQRRCCQAAIDSWI